MNPKGRDCPWCEVAERPGDTRDRGREADRDVTVIASGVTVDVKQIVIVTEIVVVGQVVGKDAGAVGAV